MADRQAPVVYVDTNPIIYALEAPEDIALALKALFQCFKSRPGIAVTSELTLAEVLVKRRVPDRDYLDLVVWSRIFDLRPVSRDVLYETVGYRRIASVKRPDGSVKMPKLPDSIHAVTAIQAECRFFLSSDQSMKLPESMQLICADVAGVASLIRELA